MRYTKRWKTTILGMIMLLFCMAAPALAETEMTVTISGIRDYDMAVQVVPLINEQRTNAGAGTVVMNPQLQEEAMKRAEEIAVYYSHTRTNGSSCFTVIPDRTGMYVAENIAAGYDSSSSVMNGWMNSSGHKANILNSVYRQVGVGCFKHNGYYYWVQLFTSKAEGGSCQSGKQQITTNIQVLDSYLNVKTFVSASSIYENETATVRLGSHNEYAYCVFDQTCVDFAVSDTTAGTVAPTGIYSPKKAGTVAVTASLSEQLSSTVEITTTHKKVKDAAVRATCTTDGKTEGSHCGICGQILTAQETIRATGHTVVNDAAIKETCETAGKTAGTHCSVCRENLSGNEMISPTGHFFIGEITVSPTCTTTGTRIYTCDYCGSTNFSKNPETVPAWGHNEVIDPAIESTCYREGKTEGRHCNRVGCREILVKQEPVAKKPHTVVKDLEKKQTCTEPGKTEGTHCSVCNAILSGNITVNPTGHYYIGQIRKQPTCTEAGIRFYTCDYCGDTSYTKNPESLSPLGHNLINGACSRCNYKQDGFVKIGSQWKFYKGNQVQAVKGLVSGTIDGVKAVYYVENGIYKPTASGIAQLASGPNKTWYYVRNGKYTKASGIAKKADGSSAAWFYVQNGIYTKVSGIAKKADGSSAAWFYVQNGIYTKASGIAQKADGSSATWFYVLNGIFTKATGIAKKADESSATWFYVQNGMLSKATTIAQKADKSSTTWFYVLNGLFTKTTGKVTINGKVYNIVTGVVK